MLRQVNDVGYMMRWAVETRLFHKKKPIIGVVVTNNTCNLACNYCPVKKMDPTVVSFKQIAQDIQTLYDKGVRFLTITGGEPMLWADGEKSAEDIVNYAFEMGMVEIIFCTNGTFPIDTKSDIVMVSLDGDQETHDQLNGKSYQRIMNNIDESDHPRIFIQYTITKENQQILEKTINQLQMHSHVKGILFNIYIPFVGSSLESYDPYAVTVIIKDLIQLKERYPDFVINSRTALRHLKNDDWQRPLWISTCIHNGDISPCCCRKQIVSEEICSRCYLAACVESYIVQNLEIGALFEFLKKYY